MAYPDRSGSVTAQRGILTKFKVTTELRRRSSRQHAGHPRPIAFLSPAANAITAARASYWARWTTGPWPDTELANMRITSNECTWQSSRQTRR
jgi:hypothetical protein